MNIKKLMIIGTIKFCVISTTCFGMKMIAKINTKGDMWKDIEITVDDEAWQQKETTSVGEDVGMGVAPSEIDTKQKESAPPAPISETPKYSPLTEGFLTIYYHSRSVGKAMPSLADMDSIDRSLVILRELQNHEDRKMVEEFFTLVTNRLYECTERNSDAKIKILAFIKECPDQAEYFRTIFQKIRPQRNVEWNSIFDDLRLFIAFYLLLSGVTIGLINYMR